MSIVFLSFAFPPLKYPRSIQVYRMVKHSRHSIRVVCCGTGPRCDDTIDENIPGVPVERIVLPTPPRGGPGALLERANVPDSFRGWALHAAQCMLEDEIVTRDDVLVTFAQPMSDHLAGLRIKRALGMPWVAHFSDPWVDNPYRQDMAFSRVMNRVLERSVMSAADHVVFTCRQTLDLVMAKYPVEWRQKAHVLPHAYDAELFANLPGPSQSGDRKRAVDGGIALHEPARHASARPIVGRYVGNFYSQRSPEALIGALATLQRSDPEWLRDLRIEFVGVASERARHIRRPTLPDELVDFRDAVDYRDALSLMRDADFLIVIDAPAETSVFLPSKLVDYIGAGRPILAISPPGASAELVHRLGGFVADPADPDAVVRQLRSIVEEVRNGASDPFGNPEVRAEYEAPVVVPRFDAILDGILAGAARTGSSDRD